MKKKKLLLTFIMASVFIFVFCGACVLNDYGSRSEESESVVSNEESVDNGTSESESVVSNEESVDNGTSESVVSSEESVDNSASENDRIDSIVLPEIEI